MPVGPGVHGTVARRRMASTERLEMPVRPLLSLQSFTSSCSRRGRSPGRRGRGGRRQEVVLRRQGVRRRRGRAPVAGRSGALVKRVGAVKKMFSDAVGVLRAAEAPAPLA